MGSDTHGETDLEALEGLGQGKTQAEKALRETQDALLRMIGQIQMGQTISKLSEGITIGQLRMIRERKLYRLLHSKETGRSMSFEEFCQAIGLSDGDVREKIRVINRLGTDFLRLQEAMGLPRQQVRLLLMAPSDVQADAKALAEGIAQGTVTDAEAQLARLIDRIEKVEEASAGRARILEEKEAAEAERDQAVAASKQEADAAKAFERKYKEQKSKAESLQHELDTPARLRDPQHARALLSDLVTSTEGIAYRIEETAGLGQHYADEGEYGKIATLVTFSLDIAASILDRIVRAYSLLIGVAQNAGDEDVYEHHCCALGLVRGELDLIQLAQEVNNLRAQAAAAARQQPDA